MKAAFLGLGRMGELMAQNLARAGLLEAVWNRSDGRTGWCAKAGVRAAASPADAAAGADVVILMLADGDAARTVGAEALSAMPAGSVLVDMGTSGLDRSSLKAPGDRPTRREAGIDKLMVNFGSASTGATDRYGAPKTPLLLILSNLEPNLDELNAAIDDIFLHLRTELQKALVLFGRAEAHDVFHGRRIQAPSRLASRADR